MLKNAKPLTLNVKNAPLENVLRDAFVGQPLTWKMVDKTITIVKKPEEFNVNEMINKFLSPKLIDVKGTVRNEKNELVGGILIRELNKLSVNIKLAKDKYPELFDRNSRSSSEIVRNAFIENENKAFYPTQFKPDNPYKHTNLFVSGKKTIQSLVAIRFHQMVDAALVVMLIMIEWRMLFGMLSLIRVIASWQECLVHHC